MSLTAVFHTTKQQKNEYLILKGRKCEPRSLYPVKWTFKYKGHRKTIINMQEFRKYFSISPS